MASLPQAGPKLFPTAVDNFNSVDSVGNATFHNVNSTNSANNATFLPAAPPRRRTYRVVGAVDIVHAVDIVRAVHAVDFVHTVDIAQAVHAVHTLDIAIAYPNLNIRVITLNIRVITLYIRLASLQVYNIPPIITLGRGVIQFLIESLRRVPCT